MGRTGFFKTLKRYLPQSLFGRALMIIVLPLILLQIIVAFIFYETHWTNVSRRMAFALAGDVGATVDLLESGPTAGNVERVTAMAARRFQLRIRTDPKGDLPVRSARFLDRSVDMLDGFLQSQLRYPFAIELPGDLIVIHVQRPNDTLRLTTVGKRLFSHTTYIFILWMLGSSVILIGIAVAFMRNQVRPIHRLARAVDLFGKGRDSPNFKPEGATEVRQAASAFLRMRARLQRHMNERTGMLAGVSHDLRTPLTRMKLQLAMSQGAEGTEELEEDIHEMERMLDGYLAFARGEGAEVMAPTDLRALVLESIDRAHRGGRRIELAEVAAVTLPLKPIAFKRCMDNLLQNALRFATTVSVALETSAKGATLIIEDDGPGIPEGERENVFRPFYRIEASRNPDTGGIGLGLAIARDVIRAHGGHISLGTADLGGLRVSVTLPL